MTIQRVTLTKARATPLAEFGRWTALDRVHDASEDALAKRLIAEAWRMVERHTGRLWLPAAALADRVASVEIEAASGELVSVLPPFPETLAVTLDGVDKWTAGAWVELTDIPRPDPWRFLIVSDGAYRVRSTWTAPTGDPPVHIEHAAHLVAIYLTEHRGDAVDQSGKLGSQAGVMLRSGAADLLRHDRGISV